MKKFILFFCLILTAGIVNSQIWTGATSATPKPAKLKLLSGNLQSSTIQLKVEGYSGFQVQTPNGQATIVTLEDATPILSSGDPDLPKVTTSLIIPDNAHMAIQITNSTFVEYQNVDIAPSKGNFTRDIDPASVPYTYGPSYTQNQFYPGTLAELNDPYILRDLRGQTVVFYPYQYNPVTKVLRVYTNIEVSVAPDGISSQNILSRTKALTSFDPEFSDIYKHHFLNFASTYKYTPLGEHGNLLIICYGSFMSYMEPYVIWKNTEGIPTEIVNVSTIGTTYSALQTYITNYYNTNGLTFLLLVGDVAQIPTYTVAGGGSDNSYGYILGSDHYQEIIVGRFSAESAANVQTQVTRTLNYEKNPSSTPGKYNRAIGIGSDQGPGDDSEYDYQHQRNLQTDLIGFTYTSRAELFDGSQGSLDAAGNPTAANLATEVNAGAGIITYTGHGSDNAFSTTGFSNTNIGNLTNNNILPFIWSVACVNGNFTAGTCFAEGWLRATYNSQPAGAVATLMSTINQSWNPPMEGQDEMVAILAESYTNNIKRTFGGISVNGMYQMNDAYSDFNMTDTWTLFGDPSLMVRTDNPATMTVTHNPTINLGETSMVVNCNANNALVCLTINHEIIGTATVSGGTATVNFSALTQLDTITVCVTAFNYVPYLGEVLIVSSNFPNDAQLSGLRAPEATYGCEGISIQPEVIIKNMGTNVLTSAIVTFSVDAGSHVAYIWNGSLSQYETDTVLLSLMPLVLGNHIFDVWISLPNGVADDNTSNDSISRGFIVNNLTVSSGFIADITSFCIAPATVQFTNQSQNAQSYLWDFGDGNTSTDASPQHIYTNLGEYTVSLMASAGVCGSENHSENKFVIVGAESPIVNSASNCGPGSLVLTAVGAGTINWYDALSGGNLLTTGTSYTTPTLTTSTTYYVEQTITAPPEYVGKTDSVGGGAMHANNSYYLIFDCFSPVVLKSVKVWASTAGNRTIQLRDNSGTMLQQAIVNIPVGESRVTLNFNLPVQTGLQLFTNTTTPNMYRSSGGILFPYNLNGKVSITGTNASPSIRYYYYYDWEIESPSCVSVRVPVTAFIDANAPISNFTYAINGLIVNFTDASVNPVSYFWNFGDGSTSTDASPVHIYAADGIYSVKQVVNNGCGSDSVIQNITINTVGIIEPVDDITVSIFPNPSYQNLITIEFSSSSSIVISLFDALGRKLNTLFKNENPLNGKYQFIWDASAITAGIYYLSFESDQSKITRKMIITK